MGKKQSRKICYPFLVIVLVLVIGVIDYLKGYNLSFFVFYFIPIAIITYHYGSKAGYALCIFCTVIGYAADWLGGHPYPSLWMGYWNAAIRLAAFATVTHYIARIRSLLVSAKKEVKILRGFLPICAKCKKIRDDDGYWEQIEAYISKHADVQFSHGLCNQCAEETHRELEEYKKRMQKGVPINNDQLPIKSKPPMMTITTPYPS
jgi:hypothetical protein